MPALCSQTGQWNSFSQIQNFSSLRSPSGRFTGFSRLRITLKIYAVSGTYGNAENVQELGTGVALQFPEYSQRVAFARNVAQNRPQEMARDGPIEIFRLA